MFTIDVHSHNAGNADLTVLQSNSEPLLHFHSSGIHPVTNEDSAFKKLELLPELLIAAKCIAIGESGLDKNSQLLTEDQQTVFEKQVLLSQELNLPIIIHCVGRWNELELLFKAKRSGTPAWIIHGFRKMKLTRKFLDLGAYLSFGEAILFDEHVQKAIAEIPLDRIFLETDDAVFDIADSYVKLAELKKITVDDVEKQIRENFEKVFGKKVDSLLQNS